MNKSKKEIKSSDDLFRSIVEYSPEPIIIHAEGKIVFINNSGVKLAGAQSAEELIGQSIFDYVDQKYHEIVLKRTKQMYENWEPVPVIELELINLNNEKIEVELTAVPIMYSGSPSILVIIRDLTERKKILRSLNEMEEKYQLIFDNAPDMYFIIDPNGVVKDVNQFGANLIGYNKDELIGDYFWKVVHQEDLHKVKEQTSIIFENPEKVLELEFRKLKKDGSVIWVRERIKLLFYGENKIAELLIVCRDITERKKASEQIMMLANAIKSVRECISITDMNDKIIFVNEAFLKTYGYEENEIIGQQISLLRVESDQNNLIKEIFTKTQLGGWRGELLNKRKDGSIFPVSLSTSVIKDENGKEIAMIGVATDITAQKQSQKIQEALFKISEKSNAIENIEEYYSYIHSIVQELMYAENFYIAIYDEHTQKLNFDYFKDQFDNKPQPRKLKKGLTELVLRTGEVVFVTQENFGEFIKSGEVELIGSPSVDWIGAPLKSGDKTFGVLVVQSYSEKNRFTEKEKDILVYVSQHIATAIEQKRASELIKKSEQHLKKLNASKNRLFSIISHDLRSPFNSLLGISNVLKESYDEFDDEARKELINNLYRSSQNCFNLVENLLSWSRVEMGKVEPQPIKVNVYDLVLETFQLLQGNALKKKIELINEVNEDLYVYVDRGMFTSIVQNLVSNAIKFTNVEGKVRVIAVAKDSIVEISVIDNGVGISEDTLQKLFRIDSKVSTMGTAGESGTGLGLNLVKEYINLNKGEIWATSKKGEGSTFTFTLPKAK